MALYIKAAALFAAVVAAPLSAPPVVGPDYDAQAVIAPVHDPIAEAKAPGEEAAVVDIIQAVNRYVNDHVRGVSDLDHYGLDDLWVEYPVDGKGDCEDFALTKMGMLGQLGVPLVSETKMVSVVVKFSDGDTDGHAILAVRLPHGAVLYLDNLNREVMTRSELVHAGYTFFDWKA